MPSHLGSIGLSAPDEPAFREFALRAMKERQRVRVSGGSYVMWAIDGAELWLQLDNNGNLVGFTPHFSGNGRMSVRVAALMADPDWWLDGAVSCWVLRSDGDEAFPCLLDVPDFRWFAERAPEGRIVEVQVSAFAHELRCYENDLAYKGEQERKGKGSGVRGFAAQSFIPSGMFSPSGDDLDGGPRAEAIFSGRIRSASRLENAVSSQAYYHLEVQTLDAVVDVVAEPVVIQGDPVLGGIAPGQFWLSARLNISDAEDVPTMTRLRRVFQSRG